MNNELGRNDVCDCGSNKRYKDCHLKPEYPKEFFNAEIKAFEINKFENRAAPYISVSRVDIFYTDPRPWDVEISKLLQPLTGVNWNKEDIWQNRIVLRLNRLAHKLDALQYHSHSFKYFERRTEEAWKRYIVGNTTMNKIYEDPHLIYNTESFLFQDKSCLDVFAQVIAYSFKRE